ncbi:DUF421 domain-containing protein [Halalkalibacterium halodurans]|uniref:DUF421 domain-containing protein n=1 Tax=Halalkalibacterium halodurans TaxID=86665 RepID=A0A0M0KL26_ALKHA|nr:DUF421 domain-containing protein [Halalkalibacterium halodurans]TPE67924.1 DUF421 domain-containing protein [Halalkalibacterium halodurans]
MEWAQDIPTVLGRVAMILPLLLVVTLFMGRRSISELPVFDYIVFLVLGSVVGADLADPDVKHLPTVIAILAIALLQKAVATSLISFDRFRKLITFPPTIVIQNGQFLEQNLIKNIRYTVDNILSMLRQQNVFDVSLVELGIIEANGDLSIQMKSSHVPVTRKDFQLPPEKGTIAYPIIVEGTVQKQVLHNLGLTEDWLHQTLKQLGYHNISDIFFGSINETHNMHISLYSHHIAPKHPVLR